VRHRTFTSLVELNQCLREHLEIFHQKKHRVLRRTRLEMFEEEKKNLSGLPETSYEVAIHHRATLGLDCHLQFEKSYYSAPWRLRSKKLDVWASDRTVEIWHEGERVALHTRSCRPGRFKTNKKHYPASHQAYLEITPSFLREKARGVGVNTHKVIDQLMDTNFPLQHLRRAQGLIALAKKYSPEKLERACERALVFDKYYVPFIEGLIKNEQIEMNTKKIERLPNPHLRGDELYQ
jgi:hypothetical protein